MRLELDTAEKLAHRLITELGFTHPKPPSTGYMVGGAGRCISKPYEEYAGTRQTNAEIIHAIVPDILTIATSADAYVGGWLDIPLEGKATCYIEEATHCLVRDYAVILAKQRGEKAIFNLRTKQSEPLTP